jgi:predicted dehydrogenase
MKQDRRSRRAFLKSATTVAGVPGGAAPAVSPRRRRGAGGGPRLRFAAIGLNHGHITGQVDSVIRGGGELVAFYAKEPDLAAAFSKRYPQAKLARSEREILEDPSLKLVVSASIPNERAPLGLEVMRHGKDFMVDKPGMTTLEQLAEVRRVQAETGRIYSILYSERLENRATVKAGELVKIARSGRDRTIGLGPHP